MIVEVDDDGSDGDDNKWLWVEEAMMINEKNHENDDGGYFYSSYFVMQWIKKRTRIVGDDQIPNLNNGTIFQVCIWFTNAVCLSDPKRQKIVYPTDHLYK